MKDDSDPISVQCWYNWFSNKRKFYQKQDIVLGISFTIGISISWMHSMILYKLIPPSAQICMGCVHNYHNIISLVFKLDVFILNIIPIEFFECSVNFIH